MSLPKTKVSVFLTEREMESKFSEVGMPAVLSDCEQVRKARRSKGPLGAELKHEYDMLYTSKNTKEFVAFILYRDDPSTGISVRSIRQFVAPDGTPYELRRFHRIRSGI